MRRFLLDFDGTLVDSISSLSRVYTEFLRDFGIVGSEEEFNSICGPTIPEFVQTLAERYQLHGTVDDLIKKYRTQVDLAYDVLRPMPGVLIFLDIARARGYQPSIVTSAPYSAVTRWLHRRDLHDRFEVIVTSDGILRGKPSPDIYLKALDLLDIPAASTTAIEDSHLGVSAALAAGVPTWQLASEPANWDTPLFRGQARNWNELVERCLN